ncbi:MAG: L,D-transpeptidase family protein [Ilumatobacteraceae bacterium]
MNDLKRIVLALGCIGALATMSACSTTTSAQTNDPTTAPETTTKPVTTVPKTTDPRDTIPKTTQPATTVPETIPAITVPVLAPLAVSVEVVGPSAAAIVAVGKDDGSDTAIAKARLTQLGFFAGESDDDYDFATTQAVMAFQKYVGIEASGKLDEETAGWLTAFPEKAHGSADDGTLVEVDKAKQLLFIIVDGKTLWTFNTSTGSEIPYRSTNRNTGKPESGDSVTPNGVWKTNRERPDGWWEGDLGDIYRPKYFRGGVAIHGMTRVPNTPVSHGCVRLSTAAMDFIWENNLVPLGTPVWVHD